VAGDSTNVRAHPQPRCRSVTGHSRSSPRSALHARSADPGESQPRRGHRAHRAQLHSQDHCAPHRVECRAGGTVAARPTATVNVGSMTPGNPRSAPDAFSAGTRRLGRGRSRRTAPPHHSAVSSVAALSLRASRSLLLIISTFYLPEIIVNVWYQCVLVEKYLADQANCSMMAGTVR
jgi:hypothetical protein